jgi:hypothetical protein
MLQVNERVTVRTSKTRSKTTVTGPGGRVKEVRRVREVKEKTRVTTGKLRFGRGNAKLDDAIFTFSLPAGHSCPFAQDCLAKADRFTGKVRDGADISFRCYAASMEARHRNVRDARWHNFELLRACGSKDDMVRLILDSLSPFAGFVRVHDSGDFYSQEYFDAWVEVARRRPQTTFYAYTKSLPYWVARLGEIPGNFVLTASLGGRHDSLVASFGLRRAEVVFSEEEAREKGLEIDHDDSHAMRADSRSFALLLHGTQPSGTPAAKALSALRRAGEDGYGGRADRVREQRRLALPMAG